MTIQIGDIFYARVAYTEDPSNSSRRPVIVIDELEDNLLLLISTTSKGIRKPPTYHDQFKIPIKNWRKAGFTKPSWCRGKILIQMPKYEAESLINEKSYIGKIPPHDLNYILEELEKLNK